MFKPLLQLSFIMGEQIFYINTEITKICFWKHENIRVRSIVKGREGESYQATANVSAHNEHVLQSLK